MTENYITVQGRIQEFFRGGASVPNEANKKLKTIDFTEPVERRSHSPPPPHEYASDFKFTKENAQKQSTLRIHI